MNNGSSGVVARVVGVIARLLASLALLAVAGFCAFGFMASFEPGCWWGWKAVYAGLGAACLAGTVMVWWSGARAEP